MRIAILGAGGWGLSIAKLLYENACDVLLWEHNPEYLNLLQRNHSNDNLLHGIVLAEQIGFTGDFDEILSFSPNYLILATPSQHLRATFSAFSQRLLDRGNYLWSSSDFLGIINLAKGIEIDSLKTMSELLKEYLPLSAYPKICTLSGPSHAEEVAAHTPTTVVIAGSDEALLKDIQNLFSNNYFRVYRSTDETGVEIGGAVKNIVAIAAGIIAGLGFGDNTIGALLTRGIVEIQRLGVALGALPETFLGLSGMGDLITTAISQHSRNRFVGYEIGRGKKLQNVLADMKMVAEGVSTTLAVYRLAQNKGIEMPITEQIYKVLYENKSPIEAIQLLMTRDLKAENT